jgi:hypothetical protein
VIVLVAVVIVVMGSIAVVFSGVNTFVVSTAPSRFCDPGYNLLESSAFKPNPATLDAVQNLDALPVRRSQVLVADKAFHSRVPPMDE